MSAENQEAERDCRRPEVSQEAERAERAQARAVAALTAACSQLQLAQGAPVRPRAEARFNANGVDRAKWDSCRRRLDFGNKLMCSHWK